MELDDHGFLEELLALRRDDTWDSFFPTEPPPATCFDCFNDANPNPNPSTTDAFGVGEVATMPVPSPAEHIHPTNAGYYPFGFNEIQGVVAAAAAGVDPQQKPAAMVSSSSTSSCCLDRKTRQPSKNLMAERRRRKRLNDRLSMLRSVVPKISKMDRTSILGDTIDYMKELLERIKGLQSEIEVAGDHTQRANLLGIFKDISPNEALVRNTPQFDVERREMDTKVEICCAGKPELLLSTVSTLEALGLEIQQCVVSCFNDFGMQASCSEDMEQRTVISAEEIKQALFRNAGYGGRCM